MAIEDYLDNAKKHCEKLHNQIKKHFGEEKAKEILAGLNDLTGEETPEECAAWAVKVTERLEKAIDLEMLTAIRQECACVKTNKYSAYNKKYFPAIRQENSDDNDYLRAVAEFLNGRPRIGKKVEYISGKIITHMGESQSCGCFVIKGGWDKPPSTTWCRCCQGTLYSVLQFVFPDKICHMDILESHATNSNDCVFSTWYTDK